MRTLIKGGTIINADATTRADLLIDGEAIGLIGTDLDATADRTIDASGKWVIPGGIDVHTHMELPFGGTFAKTPSRPARGRRPSAARPPSLTSPCSRGVVPFGTASTHGARRPRARPASTTAST